MMNLQYSDNFYQNYMPCSRVHSNDSCSASHSSISSPSFDDETGADSTLDIYDTPRVPGGYPESEEGKFRQIDPFDHTTASKMRNTITSGSSNQTPTDVSSPSNTSSSAKTKEDTRRPSCKPPSMTPWVGFAKRSKLHR